MRAWDVKGGGTHKQSDRYARMLDATLRIQALKGIDRAAHPFTEKHEPEVPEYEEGRSYTQTELALMADAMLFEQSKQLPFVEYPAVLNDDMLKRRKKREIYVRAGIPDPSINSGLYWRTHPQGRSHRTEEERNGGKREFYV